MRTQAALSNQGLNEAQLTISPLKAHYSISRGSTLSNFARCDAICETACYIALLHSVSALFFSGKLLSLFRGDELQSVGSTSKSEDNISNANMF
jgi:hypothetical protein